jgi:hypothetical protein
VISRWRKVEQRSQQHQADRLVVSGLASMLTEIAKLEAVRAVGLPAALFRPGTPERVASRKLG